MIVLVLGRTSTSGWQNLGTSVMGGVLHRNDDTGERPRMHDADVGDNEDTDGTPLDVGICSAARRSLTLTRGRW